MRFDCDRDESEELLCAADEFADVQYFFSVEYRKEIPHLAYIRRYEAIREFMRRFLRVGIQLLLAVIEVSWIMEPIGVINAGEDRYFTRRSGCLWV